MIIGSTMIFRWSGIVIPNQGRSLSTPPLPHLRILTAIMKDIVEKLMASRGFFPPICFIDLLLNFLFLEYPNLTERWNYKRNRSISFASLEWNDKRTTDKGKCQRLLWVLCISNSVILSLDSFHPQCYEVYILVFQVRRLGPRGWVTCPRVHRCKVAG